MTPGGGDFSNKTRPRANAGLMLAANAGSMLVHSFKKQTSIGLKSYVPRCARSHAVNKFEPHGV